MTFNGHPGIFKRYVPFSTLGCLLQHTSHIRWNLFRHHLSQALHQIQILPLGVQNGHIHITHAHFPGLLCQCHFLICTKIYDFLEFVVHAVLWSFTLSYGRSRMFHDVSRMFHAMFFLIPNPLTCPIWTGQSLFPDHTVAVSCFDFQSQQLRPIATHFNCSYIFCIDLGDIYV